MAMVKGVHVKRAEGLLDVVMSIQGVISCKLHMPNASVLERVRGKAMIFATSSTTS